MENHLGGTAIFFNGSTGKLSTLGKQVALPDPETEEIAQDRTWEKTERIGTMLGQLVEHLEVRRSASSELYFDSEIDPVRASSERPFPPGCSCRVFAGRKPLYRDGKLDRSTIERELTDTGRIRFLTGHDVQTEVDYIQLRNGSRLVAEIATIPGEVYSELTNCGITRYPGADYSDAAIEPILRVHLKSRYQFILGLGQR